MVTSWSLLTLYHPVSSRIFPSKITRVLTSNQISQSWLPSIPSLFYLSYPSNYGRYRSWYKPWLSFPLRFLVKIFFWNFNVGRSSVTLWISSLLRRFGWTNNIACNILYIFPTPIRSSPNHDSKLFTCIPINVHESTILRSTVSKVGSWFILFNRFPKFVTEFQGIGHISIQNLNRSLPTQWFIWDVI